MPLQLLVPALLRAVSKDPPVPSAKPHPLHKLLEPLLTTTRRAAAKYHQELPQILAEGSGAGEIEETMMWFVHGYESMQVGSETGDAERTDSSSYQWWLERLERRE
jgi:hypothetical protein